MIEWRFKFISAFVFYRSTIHYECEIDLVFVQFSSKWNTTTSILFYSFYHIQLYSFHSHGPIIFVWPLHKYCQEQVSNWLLYQRLNSLFPFYIPPPFLSFPFLSFASVHLSLCAFHTMLCLLLPRTIGIPTGPSQSPVLIPPHIKSRASNFFCLGSYFPGRSLHFTKVKLRGFESFVSFAQHLNTLLRLLIHTF